MLGEEAGFSAAVDNNFDGPDHGSLCTIHPFQNPHPNNASLNKINSTHDWVANVHSIRSTAYSSAFSPQRSHPKMESSR
jgi:hypothetical protein